MGTKSSGVILDRQRGEEVLIVLCLFAEKIKRDADSGIRSVGHGDNFRTALFYKGWFDRHGSLWFYGRFLGGGSLI
jgi:hypothetical protein